jgi:hypothetical protein
MNGLFLSSPRPTIPRSTIASRRADLLRARLHGQVVTRSGNFQSATHALVAMAVIARALDARRFCLSRQLAR